MIWNFILGAALIILAITGFFFYNSSYAEWCNSPESGGTCSYSIIKYWPIIVEIAMILVGIAIIYASCRPVIM